MRVRTKVLIATLIIGVAGVASVSWWLNRDTVAAVSIDAALDDAATTDVSDEPLSLNGTWVVSGTGESFAGVRINEELRGIGAVTAVLRTPEVTGDAVISNGLLTALTINVDLTTLSSDDARRDRSIASALDFVNFPNATFVLDGTVDISGLEESEPLMFDAPGMLSINGQQQPVTARVTVAKAVGALVAVAEIPVLFGDYAVRLPSAPIVLSIADDGIIETQLRFVNR